MKAKNAVENGCSLQSCVDPVVSRYYPQLLDSAHACLAVFGAMSLGKRTKPLSLMFEGTSGFGKTAVLQMVLPAKGTELEKHVYRSDKFTPKAFVTHAANVAREDLDKMDLLPQLDKKVFVTKELAPIFRGREEEMRENFSILISILDGKGFASNSGMRGKRGYERPIIFNWVGATTPLPSSTHRLMSQLGTRLLFYEVPTNFPTDEQLLEYAEQDEASLAEDECRNAVQKFLIEFFRAHPVGSVPPESITFSKEFLSKLVLWVRFLAAGRAEVTFEKNGSNWEPVAAMPAEGPWKIVTYFKDLARGHALIRGSSTINQSDIDLVAHVAISSIPAHLRPIVRQLMCTKSVNTATAMKVCRVSHPTARSYLKQLSLLGITELTKGSPQDNQADTITLRQSYRWLNPDLEI